MSHQQGAAQGRGPPLTFDLCLQAPEVPGVLPLPEEPEQRGEEPGRPGGSPWQRLQGAAAADGAAGRGAVTRSGPDQMRFGQNQQCFTVSMLDKAPEPGRSSRTGSVQFVLFLRFKLFLIKSFPELQKNL